MSLWHFICQRLGLKILLANVVVIIVGMAVLVATTTFTSPNALADHMTRMETLMGRDPQILAEERQSFILAVNEVLLISAGAALIAAVAVSLFVTRRIVDPIRAMTEASRNIAAGDYHKRVQMLEPDELGSLAGSFNQMAQQLEQTERKRVELMGDVAHELRTPLASIRSTMEGLVDGILPPEPNIFIGVQREVTRLQRLVQDLEELSRAEAGQIALDLHPADLSQLIQMAAERLRPQYADKGVALRVDIPSFLPQVRVDAGRMTQVLINLLGNALQYTSAEGSVVVRAWQAGANVQVAVQDTGVGLTPEHLARIFERFYRVDKSRARIGGGSGIGLTIAKHLIEAHGGRIWAASDGVGQGSAFTFALPAML